MKKSIKIDVLKTVTEDSYSQGEIGRSTVYTVEEKKFSSLSVAFEYIQNNYGLLGEIFIFEDRIIVSAMENGQGYQPSKLELEKFKKDEINLYSVTYDFYLSEVTEKEFSNEELKAFFPKLQEA